MIFKRNLYVLIKHVSKINSNSFSTMSWKEIKIPVPHGYVAGKWWGPLNQRPILAMHGWQDNAGTFDRLIPLLSPKLSVLAIDQPGHGFSDNLPPGTYYHGIDAAILTRRIADYFGWPKVSLLGHSFGAIINFQYTALFPHTVDFLICLDCLQNVTISTSPFLESMMKSIDKYLYYERLTNNSEKQPPCYTYDEMKQLLYKGSRKSVSLEFTNHILDRNVKISQNDPNKYYFTRDQKVKVGPLMRWDNQMVLDAAHRIDCPVFLSIGKSSMFRNFEDECKKVLDIIGKRRSTECHIVDGTHHLHLNTPENIAPLINEFILKHGEGDRTFEEPKQNVFVQ